MNFHNFLDFAANFPKVLEKKHWVLKFIYFMFKFAKQKSVRHWCFLKHIFSLHAYLRYHLKDVIVGKIYFLLVRIKIRYMELAIVRRETTGAGDL